SSLFASGGCAALLTLSLRDALPILRVAAGDRGRDGARSGRVLVERQAGRIGADGEVVRRHRQGHRRRVSGGGTRAGDGDGVRTGDRKSTRLNSSHGSTSYTVFCSNK